MIRAPARALAGAGLAAVLASLVALLWAPAGGAAGPVPAGPKIYWANEASGTIGRAELGGSGVDHAFITGATSPRGVAVDGSHLYWSHDGGGGSIGRAALDKSSVTQGFVATAGPPSGLSVNGSHVYWTQIVAGNGRVGRARLDGGAPNQSSVSAAGADPCGLAVTADDIYWGNRGSPGIVNRAHIGGPPDPPFITATSDPCGVAVTAQHVYWANAGSKSIGRANLDGSGAVRDFIALTSAPCGVATDGERLFWTSTESDDIGRANLDGTGVQEDFIVGGSDPCGIAVTPRLRLSPPAHRFPGTPKRGKSGIIALVIGNTGSSVIDVTDVRLTGAHPGDFEITGDSCTPSITAAAGDCILNARFTPIASGDRQALVEITSNATVEPAEIILRGRARILRCGGRPATVVGSAIGDELRGTRRADVIATLAGRDRVSGGRGDDVICAGRGPDALGGGAGDDRLLGGAGADLLRGGRGDDELRGGRGGGDRCRPGPGDDELGGCP